MSIFVRRRALPLTAALAISMAAVIFMIFDAHAQDAASCSRSSLQSLMLQPNAGLSDDASNIVLACGQLWCTWKYDVRNGSAVLVV